ncbi:MAG: PAS domain S-box protein, partial [Pyrinomonadaceae bacterium]
MTLETRKAHPSLEKPWETDARRDHYRRLFDESPRPMWVCDADTLTCLEANEAAARLFEYERDAFCHLTLRSLCVAENFDTLVARVAELEGDRTATLETRFVKRDGAVLDAEVTLRLISFRGTARALLVLADDVTERRRAEAALRESERRYRVLVEQASDGIFIYDESGRYLQVNPKGCEMLGYTEAELLRLNVQDVIDAEDLALRPFSMKEVLEGRTVLLDRRFRRKDGSFLDGEINASRLDDGRIQAIVRDITEPNRVKAEMQAAAAELSALFAAIPDVILVFDSAGRHQKIAPTNPTLLIKPSTELLGKSLHDVFPPERADEFLGYIRAALGGKRAIEVEYSLELNGHTRWFAGSVSPMSGESVIWVARDVTENKLFEQYLLQSEERYRELFENANDIVYTHDLAGRFTSLNKTGERIIGYRRDEAMRLNIAHVIAPEDVDRARAMIARKATQEVATVYELTAIAKDGRRVPLEISTRLLYRDGQAVGVQGIARDISERRRA